MIYIYIYIFIYIYRYIDIDIFGTIILHGTPLVTRNSAVWNAVAKFWGATGDPCADLFQRTMGV